MSRGGRGLANEHPGGFSPVEGGGVTLELPFMCDTGLLLPAERGGLVLMGSERHRGERVHLPAPLRASARRRLCYLLTSASVPQRQLFEGVH